MINYECYNNKSFNFQLPEKKIENFFNECFYNPYAAKILYLIAIIFTIIILILCIIRLDFINSLNTRIKNFALLIISIIISIVLYTLLINILLCRYIFSQDISYFIDNIILYFLLSLILLCFGIFGKAIYHKYNNSQQMIISDDNIQEVLFYYFLLLNTTIIDLVNLLLCGLLLCIIFVVYSNIKY